MLHSWSRTGEYDLWGTCPLVAQTPPTRLTFPDQTSAHVVSITHGQTESGTSFKPWPTHTFTAKLLKIYDFLHGAWHVTEALGPAWEDCFQSDALDGALAGAGLGWGLLRVHREHPQNGSVQEALSFPGYR